MSLSAKILLGVIPACIWLLLGLVLLGVSFSSTIHQKVLLILAVLGTCGMIWSLVGYSRRTAALVLTLLSIGILGMLGGGLIAAIDGLVTSARNNKLGSPLLLLLRLLFTSWLIFGPTVVGLVQARRAVRVLREGI